MGFAIAGKDGRFQLADANVLMFMDKQGKPQQDRTSIVLTSPLVPEPIYFRHAWGRNPLANVKTQEHVDLPLPAIRNDTWTIADMYELYTGKKPATLNALDGRENGELLHALRADDLKRRLLKARELIKAIGG